MTSTGIIYDESMADYRYRVHNCKLLRILYMFFLCSCLFDPTHVEKPDRLRRVLERCRHYGLVERCVDLRPTSASEAEVRTNHTQELIDFLKSMEKVTDPEELKEFSKR